MLIFHGNRKDNKIALTFDDGPNPYGTRKVLDILDKYKVKATFFLIGKWIKLYPDIVRKIDKRGHLIGNHGYYHSRYNRDRGKFESEIFKLTKKIPIYIRPPFFTGYILHIPEILSKRLYVVATDVVYFDWLGWNKNKIIKHIVTNVKNGSIILFHDGNYKESEGKNCKEMLKALPKIIESLKRKYKLVRLDKMKF